MPESSEGGVYLGLGGNVGDTALAMDRACEALIACGIAVLKRSDTLHTKPYGGVDQADFLNCVIEVATDLTPEALLSQIKAIEVELGRQQRERWGPREIDIDIILYRHTIVRSSALTVPHEDMVNRDFVMRPLAQIAPDVIHPVLGKTIHVLAESHHGNS